MRRKVLRTLNKWVICEGELKIFRFRCLTQKQSGVLGCLNTRICQEKQEIGLLIFALSIGFIEER